jgi:hypothetical protein
VTGSDAGIFFAPDNESSVPGIFSDEARCSLFIKSGGKTGAFCNGRGRFRQTARQFFGLPITCRLVSAQNYYSGSSACG